MSTSLRPYQKAAIEKFLNNTPHRLLLAHAMGSGKSRTAIEAVKQIQAVKILVVSPAIVRQNWIREFSRWYPEAKPAAIKWGRKRTKGLSKAELLERDAAFNADIQVVSYALLDEVDTTWDAIIIDETHKLRSPLSQQSKLVRALARNNPDAAMLALSGTAIPNEIRQIWGPIDTLFPAALGQAQKTGREPWSFLNKYCLTSKNEYGTQHFGFKKEKQAQLLKELGPYIHEVAQSELAQFLPDLFVEPLILDEPRLLSAVTIDWLETLDENTTHIGIFTHLRNTAADVAAALKEKFPEIPTYLVTGDISADHRDEALQAAKANEKAFIVGTTHSLNEGISLSFIKAALVLEWTAELDQVTQFIGRFARQDSLNNMPTFVRFVQTLEDTEKAQRLQTRVENRNLILKAGRAETIATNLFKPIELSDDKIDALFQGALNSFRLELNEWETEEEDNS